MSLQKQKWCSGKEPLETENCFSGSGNGGIRALMSLVPHSVCVLYYVLGGNVPWTDLQELQHLSGWSEEITVPLNTVLPLTLIYCLEHNLGLSSEGQDTPNCGGAIFIGHTSACLGLNSLFIFISTPRPCTPISICIRLLSLSLYWLFSNTVE